MVWLNMIKRGQFSFDLMIVVGIMLVLFLALFQFYVGKAEGAANTRAKLSAKAITDSLAARINSVAQSGNGTVSRFRLPQTIADGKNYTIGIPGRRVEVSADGMSVSSLISAAATVSGDLNLKKGGEIQISNVDNGIFVE